MNEMFLRALRTQSDPLATPPDQQPTVETQAEETPAAQGTIPAPQSAQTRLLLSNGKRLCERVQNNIDFSHQLCEQAEIDIETSRARIEKSRKRRDEFMTHLF